MEFVEKHKALIITSMLMGILLLSLYNINMVNNKIKEQSEILLLIPDEIMEQLLEEEPEEPIIEEERELIDAKRTHDAYNEDFEDSDDFEKRLKSLTEVTEAESEPAESKELAQGEAAINENIAEETVEKKEKSASKESYNRNSSSTYELKNRKVVGRLPNPIYTCEGSGKVVVKIEVNQNGYVIDTKIDKKKSTTRNECLFDNALEYATKALFTDAALKSQKGSITYYFNYGG